MQTLDIIINSGGDTLPIATNAIGDYSSALVSRRHLGAYLGRGFEGARDYYKVLGYEVEPIVEDYLSRYTRDDIAGRVVDLPPQDTWKKRPILIDGDSRSDDDDPQSPFIQAWQQLTEGDDWSNEDDDTSSVYSYMERVDRVAGIGRYGVLLIGAKDGLLLDQPLRGKLTGSGDILYYRVASEASCMIGPSDIEDNPQSKRFGKPKSYQIDMGEGVGYRRVHYSRCVHVAEDLTEDEVYGRPRLERILNRLDDLMKIVGGSAEATWKLMRKGILLSTRDGYQYDDTSKRRMHEQIEEYDHGLRRILTLNGVDATDLGSQVVDPSGIFAIIISLIAAAADIPQRILIGSERGELASSQDMRNWAGVIANRQTNFAEPTILRPVVNWFIRYGILPPPQSGKYKVEWPTLYELTELEEADIALKRSQAITDYIAQTGAVDIVPPGEFREKVLGWPAEYEGMIEPVETEEDREDFEAIMELVEPSLNGAGQ